MNLYERLKQEPATIEVLSKEFNIGKSSLRNKIVRMARFFPEIKRRRISLKKPNERRISRFLYYISEK